MNIRHSKKLLTIAALSAALLAPVTNAATGSVDIDITFPPLVTLYYYPNIDIDVDATHYADLLSNGTILSTQCTTSGGGGISTMDCAASTDPLALSTATIVGSPATYDADIVNDATTLTALNTDITFVLNNSWAVLSTASSLTASISLSGTGDFSSESISPTSPTSSFTLTPGANVGSIQFDVDVTAAAVMADNIAEDTITITVIGV